jgi:hypothetical protein
MPKEILQLLVTPQKNKDLALKIRVLFTVIDFTSIYFAILHDDHEFVEPN